MAHTHTKSFVHPLPIRGSACSCPPLPHTSHILPSSASRHCSSCMPLPHLPPPPQCYGIPSPHVVRPLPRLPHPHCAGIQYEFSDDEDIHTVASLLKLYLRELPVPLIEYSLYDSFSKATRSECWLRTPPVENRLADSVHSLWWAACQCGSPPSAVMCW